MPEAAGGLLFSSEQPAVHPAGWNPIQRGKEADFLARRPAGLLEATWPLKHESGLIPPVVTGPYQTPCIGIGMAIQAISIHSAQQVIPVHAMRAIQAIPV